MVIAAEGRHHRARSRHTPSAQVNLMPKVRTAFRNRLRQYQSVEQLENRLLLATDLLPDLAATTTTLSSNPKNLIRVGDHLFFDARTDASTTDASASRRIFRSDGTDDGTVVVLEQPGTLDNHGVLDSGVVFVPAESNFSASNRVGDPVYFADTDGARLIVPPTSVSLPIVPGTDVITLSGERTLLVRSNFQRAIDLLATDGTNFNRQILPFNNSQPHLLGVSDGEAWFSDQGLIWTTRGSGSSFRGVGPVFQQITAYHAIDRDTFLFEAILDRSEDGAPAANAKDQRRLFLLEGNLDQSREELTVTELPFSSVSDMTVVADRGYFVANSAEQGRGLWRISNSNSVELVMSVETNNGAAMPQFLTPWNNRLYFSIGHGIYQHDPNGNSTKLVKQFEGSPTSFGPRSLTVWQDRIVFTADDGEGEELWATDGSTATLLADINPGPQGSGPNWLTPFEDTLYFTATTPDVGNELWSISADGEAELVLDIRQDVRRPLPAIGGLTNFQDIVYFRHDDGVHGVELWRSDGTVAGTSMLRDIWPGERGGAPRDFFVHDEQMYFTANDGEHGYELWKTDGTTQGTQLVADLWPGSEGSVPGAFAIRAGEVWFAAHDGTPNAEIWSTDGTEDGTRLIEDVEGIVEPIREILFTNEFVHVWGGTEWREQLTQLSENSPARTFFSPQNTPRVLGDYLFFTGSASPSNPVVDGLQKVDARSSTTLPTQIALSVGDDLPIEDEMRLAEFEDHMYYTTRNGVFKTDGPSDGEPSGFPEQVGAIAATDSHLIGLEDGRTEVTIHSLSSDGSVESVLSQPGRLLELNVDPRGFAVLIQSRQDTTRGEIWYSDGTSAGTRIVDAVELADEPNSLMRSGNNLFFVKNNSTGLPTLGAVSLEPLGDADFNLDGKVDIDDVDLLFAALQSESPEVQFDLNMDDEVSFVDAQVMFERITETQPGDLDLNGRVEFADFLIVSTNFGKELGRYSEGDTNADGKVDFEDFLMLSANFGDS